MGAWTPEPPKAKPRSSGLGADLSSLGAAALSNQYFLHPEIRQCLPAQGDGLGRQDAKAETFEGRSGRDADLAMEAVHPLVPGEPFHVFQQRAGNAPGLMFGMDIEHVDMPVGFKVGKSCRRTAD